jgi:hypothetical protein
LINVERINDIISLCCEQHRKGPAVTEEELDDLQVTTVMAMPHVDDLPPEFLCVDVHFFVVAVSNEANDYRSELIELLEPWERLKSGPSYIEVGAELGDQGAALCLFGLGEALGFWHVVTPAKLGITGEKADQLAGRGFVMCSGFDPKDVA